MDGGAPQTHPFFTDHGYGVATVDGLVVIFQELYEVGRGPSSVPVPSPVQCRFASSTRAEDQEPASAPAMANTIILWGWGFGHFVLLTTGSEGLFQLLYDTRLILWGFRFLYQGTGVNKLSREERAQIEKYLLKARESNKCKGIPTRSHTKLFTMEHIVQNAIILF